MRQLSFLISILLMASNARADADVKRIVDRRIVMGVECRITVYAPSEEVSRSATRDAFARMEEIEREISSWRPGSQTSQLHQRVGEKVQLGPDLFEVLWRGLTWARRSDGAFDPTIGVLCDVWREAHSEKRLPSKELIGRGRECSGWKLVKLDLDSRSATITREGLKLDFGGIGKGYAADEALRVLRAHGLGSAIIELGGDVVAGDPPPGRDGWTVTIGGVPGAGPESFELVRGAMATSGDLEQHAEIDGTRYSHIIDPKSGMAITSPMQVSAIVRGGITPGADAGEQRIPEAL